MSSQGCGESRARLGKALAHAEPMLANDLCSYFWVLRCL